VFAGAVACGFDLATPLVAMLEPLIGGSDRARLPAALAGRPRAALTIAATLAIVAASLFVIASPRGVPTVRLAGMATIALTFTAGLTAFGTYPVARKLTTRPFAERVAAHLRPGDRLCACGDLDRTLRFYLGTPVPPCGTQVARASVRRSSAIEADTTDTHGGPRHYRVRPLHDAARTTAPCATRRHRGVALQEDQAL